jgi:hypothetical protein
MSATSVAKARGSMTLGKLTTSDQVTLTAHLLLHIGLVMQAEETSH